MKLKIACFNPKTSLYFYEYITLTSLVFSTPESGVEALRKMYAMCAPEIEILHAVRLDEVERGLY